MYVSRRFGISLVALWSVLSACGGGFTEQADKSLTMALTATNAARDNFVEYDKDHQLDLVRSASSRAEAEAAVAAYQPRRAAVLRAFTAAYSTIAAAAALVPLVEKGEKKERDLRALLAAAVKAAIDVKAAVDALRKGGP